MTDRQRLMRWSAGFCFAAAGYTVALWQIVVAAKDGDIGNGLLALGTAYLWLATMAVARYGYWSWVEYMELMQLYGEGHESL